MHSLYPLPWAYGFASRYFQQTSVLAASSLLVSLTPSLSGVELVLLVLEALEFFDEDLGVFWHSSLQKLSGPSSGSSWLSFIWVPKVPFLLALPVLCIFAFPWNLTSVFNTLFFPYVGIGAIAPIRRVGDSLPESALSLYLSSLDPV